ncbi:MAG: primosomal protein N' [Pseudolabrys sp.]
MPSVPGGRAAAGDAKAPARVGVLLPLPLRGTYDYAVPADLPLALGDFVQVPLGHAQQTGVVWNHGSGDGIAAEKLKQVASRFDAPSMPAVTRQFIDWVAGYTLSSPGAVLRMAMSVPEALTPPKPVLVYRVATQPSASKITPSRRKVLDLLADGGAHAPAIIAERAEVSGAVVRAMADAGLLATDLALPDDGLPVPDPNAPGPSLSPAQKSAVVALTSAVEKREFAVTLIDGVTGSGKTEVYFEAIAETLRRGQQVLVLLPEIALGAQWLARFEARFNAPPAPWHSDLGNALRRRVWRQVAENKVKVVVGARSGLFLPFADLGLIVIDEEHDTSFKQEDGVIYHARDMAVVRARLGNFPLVLASATPSLESLANVEAGRYARLHLPERHGGAEMPSIELIDLRRHAPAPQSWISPPLHRAIERTLDAREQAMIFLNRRGYAPLTLCRACGHRFQCPQCTAWLVEHRLQGTLACHHCGYTARPPDACPKCGALHSLTACGPGVERVAEEVAKLFPAARTSIMASDTIRGPDEAEALVGAMQRREIDLLIGTQIMAKGHHFPWLTLVGVVDADLGLAGGDLRAAERTFQLLSQVAGRAGRAERPGRVLLQTYMPESPVMQALAKLDRDAFVAAEAEARRAHRMPPYGRLAALIVSGPQLEHVAAAARALARAAPRQDDVQVFGPAPAPLAMLRGLHRQRLLLKASRDVNVQGVLRRWLASVKRPSDVKVKVDIDPYSFL